MQARRIPALVDVAVLDFGSPFSSLEFADERLVAVLQCRSVPFDCGMAA